MTRTDSFVVGTLVVLLAVIAGLVSAPSILPATASVATPQPTPGIVTARPYREGVLGHPVSVSPFGAKTQADRDLVALVFSGLVRNGPNGTLVPDLADHWSVDATGSVWTFQLRDDARWHDGEPVTSDDVAYTIHVLQDPAYTGPAAGSWNEVTCQDRGTADRSSSRSGRRWAGSSRRPPSRSRRPTSWPTSRSTSWRRRRSVVNRSGRDRSRWPASTTSTPSSSRRRPCSRRRRRPPEPSALATDSLATPGPAERPSRPVPYLAGMDFTFFDDAQALADAFSEGGLDAASGLSPAMTRDLARQPGTRSINYPGATMTAVLLNLRPGHPEFADPMVRTALLEAIDRVQLVVGRVRRRRRRVVRPDPAVVVDVRSDRRPARRLRSGRRRGRAQEGRLDKAADGWRLPEGQGALALELLSPDQVSNPAAFAAAEAVTRDWSALGLTVTHIALSPGDFVTGRLATGKFQVAVGDVTVGLDPDLYPLLASSQTVTGGSNVIGLQDPALDKLLVAARGPGTDAQRD